MKLLASRLIFPFLRVVIFSLTACCISCVPLILKEAATPPIHGVVLSAHNRKPVSQAHVSMTDHDGKVRSQTITRDDGSFSLKAGTRWEFVLFPISLMGDRFATGNLSIEHPAFVPFNRKHARSVYKPILLKRKN